MRINRDLANEIGLNESIVLLQIEYLISISSNERDGRLWTYQSLADLKEVYFPWWSMMTISRIIRSLEEKNLIVIGHFNKLGYDRTQWFALNEEGINGLHSVAIYQNDKWNKPDTNAIYQNDKSIYQNGDIDPNKMLNGTQQNVTTIPETTQRLHKERERAKPAPTRQSDMSNLSEPVQLYKELTGTKSVPPSVARQIADTVVDIPFWQKAIAAWLGAGFKPNNATGMLDWYLHPEKMERKVAGPQSKPAERVAPTVAAGYVQRKKTDDILTPKQIAELAQARKNGIGK
jgi:hypothetical protein